MASVLWPLAFQPGCLFPGVGLLSELQRRGHHVTALATPRAERVLTGLGFAFVADRRGGGGGPPGSFDSALHHMTGRAMATMDQVDHLVGRGGFDVVVADAFRIGAGFAADANKLPWAAYTHHYFDERGVSEGILEMHWQWFAPPLSLLEAFTTWWEQLTQGLGVRASPEAVAPAWWNLSDSLTLVTGLPELKAHADPDAPSFVRRIGPVLWDNPGNDRGLPPWLDGLGAERPAVLLALSSGVDDSPLLSAAVDALADNRYEVVATTPGRTGGTPAWMHSAPHIPHSALLAKVALVIATGGHGTVNRAAVSGVPALLVPRAYDQPLLAEAARRAGFAHVLSADNLNAAELRAQIDQLATDQDARRHALALADHSRRYQAPATAADEIEALLATS